MPLVYGKKAIQEKLKNCKKAVLSVRNTANKQHLQEIIKIAEKKQIPVRYLEKSEFDKKSPESNTQNIFLEIEEEYDFIISEEQFKEDIVFLADNNLQVMILDGIKDIGNYGAILRSCLLFNTNYVVLPKDNSAPVNEVVIKRSAGAIFQLKIVYVTNLVRIIEFLKNNDFWLYAASMEGTPINTIKFDSKKTALVLGDEGKGIRKLVKENCDFIVKIPTNEKLDSLNVSVSAGIFLYQIFINNELL